MEIVDTTEFRRDLLIYFSSLFGWSIVLIVLSLTLESSAERAGLQAPVHLALPIAAAFFVSVLASLVIGRWTTSAVLKGIKNRVDGQGFLRDNRSSIFSDFGFNLFFGVLLGMTYFGIDICEQFPHSTAPGMETTLSCYLTAQTGTAVLAGLGAGFILWIYLQTRQTEAAANMKITVQRYKTRSWSFGIILGGAGLTYVIVYAFYKIFTLGH